MPGPAGRRGSRGLWRIGLYGTCLVDVSLHDADFTIANLSGANLRITINDSGQVS
ncbi:pentapeptide repeat-containing protein [Amycolatopsis sp. cmx-4-68]|uniref:pentapeptide repeat-containing protein n=1 Tax=Amycolatopsis sp. cmx-4-68 TaxID=2790938 RepID=UPI00397831CE